MTARHCLVLAVLSAALLACGCSDPSRIANESINDLKKRNDVRIKKIQNKASVDGAAVRAKAKEVENAITIAEKDAEEKAVLIEKKAEKERMTKMTETENSIKECEAARTEARKAAEQKASLKDEVNMRLFVAEVERRKAEYKLALTNYDLEKEAYKKARVAYLANEEEIEATKKLNLARGFDPRSNVGRMRLQEIIKLHPDTQSAKDAKALLSGDDFKIVMVRKTPKSLPEPTVPRRPVLVLPEEPKKVAVEYTDEFDKRIAQLVAQKNALINSSNDTAITADARRRARKEAAHARGQQVEKAVDEINGEAAEAIAAIRAETQEFARQSEAEAQEEIARRRAIIDWIVSVLVYLALLFVSIFIYGLPILVAVLRRHPHTSGITIVSIFLGFTVVGWGIALVWAALSFPKDDEDRTTVAL